MPLGPLRQGHAHRPLRPHPGAEPALRPHLGALARRLVAPLPGAPAKRPVDGGLEQAWHCAATYAWHPELTRLEVRLLTARAAEANDGTHGRMDWHHTRQPWKQPTTEYAGSDRPRPIRRDKAPYHRPCRPGSAAARLVRARRQAPSVAHSPPQAFSPTRDNGAYRA